MENVGELKGDWDEIKQKLKQKFASLTDDDVLMESGKQNEMLSRIQAKLGKTKLEIRHIISQM